jgi:hypothetical protein
VIWWGIRSESRSTNLKWYISHFASCGQAGQMDVSNVLNRVPFAPLLHCVLLLLPFNVNTCLLLHTQGRGVNISWNLPVTTKLPNDRCFIRGVYGVRQGSPTVCPRAPRRQRVFDYSRILLHKQLKEGDFGQCLRLMVSCIWDRIKI